MRSVQEGLWKKIGPALILVILSLLTGLEAISQDRLSQALESYDQGMQSDDRNARMQKFRQAERLFQAALEQQEASAALWTNLGNAALQSERIGPAILAYRRALILDPSYDRAKQNLAHSRSLMPEWIPTPNQGGLLDTFFFWHTTVARSTRASLAAIAFAGVSLALSASLLLRVSPLRYLAGLLGIVFITLVASVAMDPANEAYLEAVVVVPDTAARAADSINAPLRFGQSLPSGAELRIIEDRGGWLHIELHNGRDAWLTQSQVERLSPHPL
ncbi:MAG: hypothetical protein CL917_00885 [Deltaproteobacteria bacterium]|nr:hypothetical protein [Deltaproteobacteria bacterium]